MKIGLDIILTIILAVLKLTGILHISWFVVFLPVIISTGVLALLLLLIGIVAVKLQKEGRIQ